MEDRIDETAAQSVLENLPKLAKSEFYIRPREKLTEDQESEYKDILLSLPAKHRVRTPVQNLCIRYAKMMVTIRKMETEVEQQGVTVVGSQGQLAKHPLLATISSYNTQLSNLTKQLHLGLEEDRRTTEKQRQREEEQASALKTTRRSNGLLATPRSWEN